MTNNKFIWCLKQMLPLTYWTTYGDKEGSHFVIWKMIWGKCFNVCDVLIHNELDYIPGIGGGKHKTAELEARLTRYFEDKLAVSEYSKRPENRLTEYFEEAMTEEGMDPLAVYEHPHGDEESRQIADETTAELKKLVTGRTNEAAFREIVKVLLSKNMFPTPTMLNHIVGSVSKNNLNSKRTRWRNDELIKAGYHKLNNRWRKMVDISV